MRTAADHRRFATDRPSLLPLERQCSIAHRPSHTPPAGFQHIAKPPLRPLRTMVLSRAIPRSDVAQQRHKIIRKRVALVSEESVSAVTVGTAPTPTGDSTHAHLHYWQ